MINIPAALQDKLDAGATTLAWCWLLTRRDGQRFGFTDHDRALSVEGVLCRPETGFVPGAVRAEAGFSPARAAVFGALDDDAITAEDLDNAVWDSASVEVLRVDWSKPSLFFTVFRGELGAVKRTANGFEAELSGPTARLSRVIGRVYARSCDAELGDARCGVDLNTQQHVETGTVSSLISERAIIVSGLSARPSAWWTNGVALWTSGSNAGAQQRILAHRIAEYGALIELDAAPASAISLGETLSLTTGCDKRFETCRDKFANGLNFRGCPHMPGADVVVRPVSAETRRDGTAR